MKTYTFLLITLTALGACSKGELGTYGDAEFSTENAVMASEIPQALEAADSLEMTVVGDVTAACQAKGCWMTMDLGNGQEMTVTFKDYGFFVPKNSGGNKAVIKGMVKKEVQSVAMLREYAKDSGKSEEEIAEITEPKTSIKFVAQGVIFQS